MLEIAERPDNKQDQLEYDLKYNKYKISCILRDSKILKVTISRTLRDNKNSLTFVDSYCMLSDTLLRLGKNFEVATIKSKFPYKFSTKSNLFYKGATPAINYYANDIKSDEYALLNIPHWSFYDETIKYLANDLQSLYEILIKANKQFFRDYGVKISANITISGLSVRIYLKDFYGNKIAEVKKSSMYKDLKLAYYGGITEVYKPYGEGLYYYDVNSLYPYLALQDMPGLDCSKILYYTEKQGIEKLFGFFYCSIEAPLNGYLGLLPLRRKSGLTFPLGKWKGWYFSEELKFAELNGYKIKVLKGYSFNRQADAFKDYIEKVYNIKSNPNNKTQKSIAKSLLNNLLGRFGINLEKPTTEMLTRKSF